MAKSVYRLCIAFYLVALSSGDDASVVLEKCDTEVKQLAQCINDHKDHESKIAWEDVLKPLLEADDAKAVRVSPIPNESDPWEPDLKFPHQTEAGSGNWALVGHARDYGVPWETNLKTLIDAGDAKAALPDYDCWVSESVPHDVWADLYDICNSFTLATGNLRDYLPAASELKAIGEKHAVALMGYKRSFAESYLAKHCHYGLLALRLGQWIVCLLMSVTDFGAGSAVSPQRCAQTSLSLADVLSPPTTLPTFLNSRWARPFSALAEFGRRVIRSSNFSTSHSASLTYVKPFLDCRHLPPGPAESGMDWLRFSEAVVDDNSRDGIVSDWIMKTLRFAFAPRMLKNITSKINECPLGVLTMLLEKIHVAQVARTEEYGKLVQPIPVILYALDAALQELKERAPDRLAAILSSRWPVLPLLSSMGRATQADTEANKHGYQYKPYALDFKAEEILRSRVERAELPELRRKSREQHVQVLHQQLTRAENSQTYEQLLRALVSALYTYQPRAYGIYGTKLIVYTMIWGARLSKYLRNVLQRAKAFSLESRYLVFCLDDAAFLACQEVHPVMEMCIFGTLQTIYNKYTMLAAVVHLGFDALYLDFDTLLLKDPVPLIYEAAEAGGYEILVSRDFGAACLNTGVIYLKAHPQVAEFLVALLVWLWHHPYEFSQKAFSAFLGHENSTDIRFFPLPLDTVPAWEVLEPMNAFVTSAVYDLGVEGWTGTMDGIVIFHFLDGTGGVDPERAIEGKYLNLYDLFYDNPRLNLSDLTRPLWEQDERIRHVLMRSRLDKPPQTLIPCMLMDEPSE